MCIYRNSYLGNVVLIKLFVAPLYLVKFYYIFHVISMVQYSVDPCYKHDHLIKLSHVEYFYDHFLCSNRVIV